MQHTPEHLPDHSFHKALLAAVEDEIARPDAEGKAYEVSTRGKLLEAVVDAIAKYEAIHWPIKPPSRRDRERYGHGRG